MKMNNKMTRWVLALWASVLYAVLSAVETMLSPVVWMKMRTTEWRDALTLKTLFWREPEWKKGNVMDRFVSVPPREPMSDADEWEANNIAEEARL